MLKLNIFCISSHMESFAREYPELVLVCAQYLHVRDMFMLSCTVRALRHLRYTEHTAHWLRYRVCMRDVDNITYAIDDGVSTRTHVGQSVHYHYAHYGETVGYMHSWTGIDMLKNGYISSLDDDMPRTDKLYHVIELTVNHTHVQEPNAGAGALLAFYTDFEIGVFV